MEKKSKKNGKKGKHWENIPNPSPLANIYNGPIVSKASKEEADLVTTTLNFTGGIASTAGGQIDSFYSSDPSSYALADWTNLVALYHEYRTLGMRVEFFPNNRYSKAATTCTPAIAVVDRGTSGTLGSYQNAMSHASAKKVSWEDPWMMEARMENVEESQFLPTSGPTALFWIKFYSDGLSVTTTYGRFFVYLLLQMRGRK